MTLFMGVFGRSRSRVWIPRSLHTFIRVFTAEAVGRQIASALLERCASLPYYCSTEGNTPAGG